MTTAFGPRTRTRVAAACATAGLAAALTFGTAGTAFAIAPTAVADFYAVTAGTPRTVSAAEGILANDTDPENDPVSIHTLWSNGGSLPGEELVPNPDGSFTYYPPTGYTGTREWLYRAQDASEVSPVVTITFAITAAPAAPVNNAPVPADDAYSVLPGQQLVVVPGVLINDTDPDGDALTVTQVAPGDPALPGESLVVDPDGKVTYTAPAGYDGVRYWYYAVSDGSAEPVWAAIVFDVDPYLLNLTPSPSDDAYDVVQDTTLTVAGPAMLANDWDFEGDPISLLSYVQPDVWLPGEAFSVDPATGAFSYTPPTGYVGARVLDYNIQDGFHPSTGFARITFTIAEPTEPTEPTEPSDPIDMPEPESPLPTLPSTPAQRPGSGGGAGSLASTGMDGTGIAGTAALAGLLLGGGLIARRFTRREA